MAKAVERHAGVPVWEHDGIICTGETYKAVVKLTFAKGAALADPSGLFNSSLEGNIRRAIDIHEGDKIDEKALKALIRAAVALNTSKQATARPSPFFRALYLYGHPLPARFRLRPAVAFPPNEIRGSGGCHEEQRYCDCTDRRSGFQRGPGGAQDL